MEKAVANDIANIRATLEEGLTPFLLQTKTAQQALQAEGNAALVAAYKIGALAASAAHDAFMTAMNDYIESCTSKSDWHENARLAGKMVEAQSNLEIWRKRLQR